MVGKPMYRLGLLWIMILVIFVRAAALMSLFAVWCIVLHGVIPVAGSVVGLSRGFCPFSDPALPSLSPVPHWVKLSCSNFRWCVCSSSQREWWQTGCLVASEGPQDGPCGRPVQSNLAKPGQDNLGLPRLASTTFSGTLRALQSECQGVEGPMRPRPYVVERRYADGSTHFRVRKTER